jgi:acyl carrier protein
MAADEKILNEIRDKLKVLLVENLSLEDIEPEEIADDEVLFGEGLGLDSLDAVEIVVLLQRNFNIDVKDAQKAKKVFYSIETLTEFIYDNT